MRSILIAVLAACLFACAAVKAKPEAQNIELVNEPSACGDCEFLGEVIGSQGNWFTGDYTSNKNLMEGARNELRNEAHKLGANVVHIQDSKNARSWGGCGTTNTTVVGKAYRCSR